MKKLNENKVLALEHDQHYKFAVTLLSVIVWLSIICVAILGMVLLIESYF